MSAEFIRRPLAPALNKGQASTTQQLLDRQVRGWPCSVVSVIGSIVTVKFEIQSQFTIQQIRIPLFGPEWIRYPIQEGTKGMAIPADTTLGHMSGLGPSTPPSLVSPFNLGALVFLPIANKDWTAPIDPNKLELYGPAGVVIHDVGSNTTITLDSSGVVIVNGSSTWQLTSNAVTVTTQTYTVNAPTIVLNGQLSQGTGSTKYPSTLQGPLTVVNEVTAAGIPVSTHKHPGVQSGGSDTDPPIP